MILVGRSETYPNSDYFRLKLKGTEKRKELTREVVLQMKNEFIGNQFNLAFRQWRMTWIRHLMRGYRVQTIRLARKGNFLLF